MEKFAIYSDLESACAAVDTLVRAGFAENQITTLTSVPYPNGILVHTEPEGWFRWISLGGAIFGALAGFGLAAGTALYYPVQTGDKPIIALFPTGIITYEFTMLFAILGAMVGMFLEMGLPVFGGRPYDARISEGCIGIVVRVENEEQGNRAHQVLKDAGALPTLEETI